MRSPNFPHGYDLDKLEVYWIYLICELHLDISTPQVEDLDYNSLITIQLDEERVKEEILDVTKRRMHKVVRANSHGPQK